MKNIILTILLLITTNLFSQDKDKKSLLEEMNNYYNKNKIEKLEQLTNDLLAGKYGVMDDELKFYALMYSSNVYTRDEYVKKNPQIGYDKTIELINFTKITSYEVPNRVAYLKSMNTFLDKFAKKHPEIIKASNQNTSQSNNAQSTLTSATNTEKKAQASDNKTVTLTVSGTGKTLEEAKLNALRSAIEQAFGAFISSKTEILNDNLVKDEIVSIASGNVQMYDVVSQVELPNVGYAITLSATVSIDKLTSFAESKGVVVEFKGGMFGATIKLQKLNEETEFVAVKNLLIQTLTLLESAYDFNLKVNNPQLIENDNYSVLFELNAKENENYDKLWDFFKKSIRQISLNDSEALSIENTGKKIFYLEVHGNIYKLRSFKTINALFNFCLLTSLIPSNSFIIKSNKSTVKIADNAGIFFFCSYGKYLNINGRINTEHSIFSKINQVIVKDNNNEYNLLEYVKNNKLDLARILDLRIMSRFLGIILFEDDNIVKIKPNFGLFNPEINNDGLKYTVNFKLSELEEISNFNLERISFSDMIKNFNSYRFVDDKKY
jgi:hypothetical protein